MSAVTFPVRKVVLFALLSAADFGLTWHLLRGGQAYEANPVAGWLLARHGWAGLALFKAAVTLLCVGLCAAIFRRRPRSAHRVLGFACALVAAVVLYSAGLAHAARRYPDGLYAAEMAPVREQAARVDDQFRAAAEYREALDGLGAGVSEDRVTLAEAVARLEQTEKASDPQWQAALRRLYPELRGRQRLAANLIHYTLDTSEGGAPATALADRLKADFCALYGIQLPVRRGLSGQPLTGTA